MSGQEKWSVGEGRDEVLGEVEWTKRNGGVSVRVRERRHGVGGEERWNGKKRGGVKKRGVNGRKGG